VTSVFRSCAVSYDSHERIIYTVPYGSEHSDEGSLTEADADNVCEVDGKVHGDDVSATTDKYIDEAILYHRPYCFGKFTLYAYGFFESFTQI
jgi:hypothetical protein